MHAGVGTTDSALGDDGVLDIDTTISLETTWRATEDLVSMGLVRSIGNSNYDIFFTRDCLAYSKIKHARDSLVKFCQKHGVCVTAHTPLGGVAANIEWFGTGLAEKYTKTAAQIARRWGIQRNIVVFDFELSKEDMELIESMDKKYRTNQPARFWGIDLFA
ncbi:hypothetical protein AAHE18_12G059100 [Arachis hypogaea]